MSASKAEFVVFYAWQSDRPPSRNRYFIEEAASEAAAKLNADPACPYTIRIDQDTQGVPGLCDIPATILKKIDAADAFLCDLTYIAASDRDGDNKEDDIEPRLCSNPNVLFELGYAFKTMEDKRLICVMNEHYGPAAKQIFDLAHRRFPIAFRLPNEALSQKKVKNGLVDTLVSVIRVLLPLGRRADINAVDRVADTRREFESRVRTEGFHGLIRRAGAIAIAVIPGPATQISHIKLRLHSIPPPGKQSWNPMARGNSELSVYAWKGEPCSIAEIRTDGTILGADTWVLDPAFHSNNQLIVPSGATELAIMSPVGDYLRALYKLEAPLPWTICISLLEVHGYSFLTSDTQTSPNVFPDTDIRPEPIVLKTIDGLLDWRDVARILKPAIDFIWREFGFSRGSSNYANDGIYTRRF